MDDTDTITTSEEVTDEEMEQFFVEGGGIVEEEKTVVKKPKTKRKSKPKTKSTKKAAPKRAKPADVDQFGFRKGTIKSQAAAIYARAKGATLSEVREKVGSIQYNLLTELKKRGFKIKTTEETSKGNRPAARYFLTPKK